MNILKRLLLGFLLLLPMAAFAAVVHPVGGADTWSLHVMGNGSTIASVMESIKMVINPSMGGGSFKLLLLFMAVTGFCILAIQAGFNPSQNLFKMFGYVLVVWIVSFASTSLTANVMVRDKVTQRDYVVTNVPAIVALPSSIVSEVGNWLTETIQQAYSTPDAFSLTKGGFNLFNKMKQDLDSYVITDQNLKRAMTAYIADCTIPAMAKGDMSGNDLLSSPNLVKTLEKAASEVALTHYYIPVTDTSATGGSTNRSGIKDALVITCKDAYGRLKTDLDAHASQLMDSASKQWASTGVMSPYENVMQSWMEAAHLGTDSGGAAYSRPTGLMLQKSLINTMSGDFRQAAIQSGNNEVLMGQAISQAEQSQKSGWVTSAMIFQNMMGYVYTTLQAFIFGIVPIMVVALMIPGLGKKIFVNYGQILIWLTLWEPMLSIVNYLVTLFGMQDIQTVMATGNSGFNMVNSWLVTEQGNNLTIAGSFLATMVPLLCWGLVNGSMAFTEFISHGIGSSFAMQAGAQAATGNVSLNSMGMNNLNSNKFDNAQKSTVGNQSVMAFENAGTMTTVNNMGGHMAEAHAGAMKAGLSLGKQSQDSIAHGVNAGKTDSAHSKVGADSQRGIKSEANSGTQSSVTDARNTQLTNQTQAGQGQRATEEKSHAKQEQNTNGVNAVEGTSAKMGVGTGIEAKPGGGAPAGAAGAAGAAAAAAGGKPGGKSMIPGGKLNMSADHTQQNNATVGAQRSDTTGSAAKTDSHRSLDTSTTAATSNSSSGSFTRSQGGSSGSSSSSGASRGVGADSGFSTGESYARNHTTSASFSRSLDWGASVTDDMIDIAMAAEHDNISLNDQIANMNRFYGDTSGQIAAYRQAAGGSYDALAGAGQGGGSRSALDAIGGGPTAGMLSTMGGALSEFGGGLDKGIGASKWETLQRMGAIGSGASDPTNNIRAVSVDTLGNQSLTKSMMYPAAAGGSIAAFAGNATINAFGSATAAGAGGGAASAGSTLARVAAIPGVSTGAMVVGSAAVGYGAGTLMVNNSETVRSFQNYLDRTLIAPAVNAWGPKSQVHLK